MTSVNFYSGGKPTRVIASKVAIDGSAPWVQIQIYNGDDQISDINIFGTDTVEIGKEQD